MSPVSAYLNKHRRNKEGECLITIRYGKAPGYLYRSTKLYVREDFFVEGEVTSGHPYARRYNDIIQMKKSRIMRQLHDLFHDGVITPESTNKEIAQSLAEEDPIEKKKTYFSKQANSYLEMLRNKNSISSLKNTINAVENYQRVELIDITPGWLRSFERCLLDKGLKINSVGVHMRNIRTVYNYAIDMGTVSYETYPFRRYKIKKEKSQSRALMFEEIRDLRNRVVEPYQEEYRDVFMLLFYLCGINMVDLAKLKIKKGYAEFSRTKTKVYTRIKIHPEAQKIIDKYTGEDSLIKRMQQKNYRWYNKRMNEALQKIGNMQRVGRGGKKQIDPLYPRLTTYWARHTWATLMTSIGAPVSVISMGLSHADNSMNAVYAKSDFSNLDQWNWKLINFIVEGESVKE